MELKFSGKNSLQAGFTLTEILITVTIACILIGMAAPTYRRAVEQTRLDNAVRNLSVIWSAQRVYWLENETFCDDLSTLQSEGLLSSGEILSEDTVSSAYLYAIESADEESFSATASRNQSSCWSGTVQVSESGTITGSIQGADGQVLSVMMEN